MSRMKANTKNKLFKFWFKNNLHQKLIFISKITIPQRNVLKYYAHRLFCTHFRPFIAPLEDNVIL